MLPIFSPPPEPNSLRLSRYIVREKTIPRSRCAEEKIKTFSYQSNWLGRLKYINMKNPLGFPLKFFLTLSLVLLLGSLDGHAKLGDNWETTRGDGTPGYRYSAATRTTSGRIIAVGTDGVLMFSDDNGINWDFGRIEINGISTRGTYAEIHHVPGGPLIAIRTTLEEGSEGFFNWYVQTYFLTSNDNGNTWSMQAFPVDYCTLTGEDSYRFYGVHIWGLFEGPGGQLLAYGTTSGTNTPGALLGKQKSVILGETKKCHSWGNKKVSFLDS